MRGWPPTTTAAAPLSPMSTNNGTDPWKLPANVSWDPKPPPQANNAADRNDTKAHSRSSPGRFGARGRMMEGNSISNASAALYDDSGNLLGSPRRPIAVDDEVRRSFEMPPQPPGFLDFWKKKSGAKKTTTQRPNQLPDSEFSVVTSFRKTKPFPESFHDDDDPFRPFQTTLSDDFSEPKFAAKSPKFSDFIPDPALDHVGFLTSDDDEKKVDDWKEWQKQQPATITQRSLHSRDRSTSRERRRSTERRSTSRDSARSRESTIHRESRAPPAMAPPIPPNMAQRSLRSRSREREMVPAVPPLPNKATQDVVIPVRRSNSREPRRTWQSRSREPKAIEEKVPKQNQEPIKKAPPKKEFTRNEARKQEQPPKELNSKEEAVVYAKPSRIKAQRAIAAAKATSVTRAAQVAPRSFSKHSAKLLKKKGEKLASTVVVDSTPENATTKMTSKMAAVQEYLMEVSSCDDSVSLRVGSDRSTSSDVQRLRSILRRSRSRGGEQQGHQNYREPLVSAFAVYDEEKISDPMQRAGLRLLSSAVIPIQTVIRRHLALRKALDRMLGIVILQKHLRGYTARKNFTEARNAAITVQKVQRGGTVRHQLLLKHCCAMEIQRHVRGLLASLFVFEQVYMITMVQACVRRKQAMDSAMNRMVAIIHIQSLFRGALVRSNQQRSILAATKVQTAWRCFSGRFNFQLDLLDIIIVQSVWRRSIAKKVYRETVVNRNELSATLIQSVWRSYDCTMNYLHFLADVLITQSVARRWFAQRKCTEIRNMNALTIQTAARAMKARLCLKRIKAAIAIQKTWRGFIRYADFMFTISDVVLTQSIVRRWMNRKEYPRLLNEHKSKAATLVQSCWRRYAASTDYLVTLSEIVLVQSVIRSWAKAKDYPKLLLERKVQAATKIQSQWRGCSQLSKYVVMVFEKDAATLIQAYWRRFVYFTKFLISLDSCIAIQSTFRGFSDSQKFKSVLSAVLVIQCAFRVFKAKKNTEILSVVRELHQNGKGIGFNESHAARQIQRCARGVQAREAVTLYLNSRTIQSMWRSICAKKMLRRHLAARSVQSVWRGSVAREIVTLYVSTRKIQCSWRRHVAKQKLLRHLKARTVQTSYRCSTAKRSLKQHQCARRIQSWWRGSSVRVPYLMYVACRKIQTAWRCKSLCGIYKKYCAATRIQSNWRREIRKRTFVQFVAARRVQALWRTAVQRKGFKQHLSARCLQSHWRGASRRELFKKYLAAKNVGYEENRAARLVQSFWRSKLQRSCAATRIQSMWRSKTARSAYVATTSACLIQTFWRCKSMHSAFHSFMAARKIQSIWRGTNIRGEYKQYLAARKIQSNWRGRSIQGSYSAFLATRKIQSIWRGAVMYRQYRAFFDAETAAGQQSCCTHSAATDIQAMWRGKSVYHYFRGYMAARKIQAFWRGTTIQHSYSVFVAARRIQTNWRGALQRSRFREYLASEQAAYQQRCKTNESARAIQTMWRGKSIHIAYKCFVAARRIQTLIRKHQAQRSYKEFLSARDIQTAWRCKKAHSEYKDFLAARHIQTAWRCKKAHSEYTSFVSARRIQSMWRGQQLRRAFLFFSASRRIQTNWRGYTKRAPFRHFIAARRIQTFWRCHSFHKPYREYLCARKIQTFWRCKTLANAFDHYRITRSHRYESFLSARCIQSFWRSRSSQAAYKHYKAALKIQTIWRVKHLHSCFLNYVLASKCACRIQTFWRCHSLRRTYKQFIAASNIQKAYEADSSMVGDSQLTAASRCASRIQTLWRCRSMKLAYKEYVAARSIQAVWRSHLVRKAKLQFSAARRIQTWWRCTSLASSYNNYRRVTTNVIIIQSIVRMRKAQALWSGKLRKSRPSSKSRVPPAKQIQLLHERAFSPPRQTQSSGSLNRRELRENAATAIEKSWRGFYARQNYWHALGSAILIQAFSRGWISKRRLTALRLRAVLQIDKDRHFAARVVQRFFLMVKAEVDREIRAEKKRRKARRKAKKRRDAVEESLLENVWKSTIGESPAKMDRFRSKCASHTANRNFRTPNLPRPDDSRTRSTGGHIPGQIQLRHQDDDRLSEVSTTVSRTSSAPIRRRTSNPNSTRNFAMNSPSRSMSKIEVEDNLALEEAWIDAGIKDARLRRREEKRSRARNLDQTSIASEDRSHRRQDSLSSVDRPGRDQHSAMSRRSASEVRRRHDQSHVVSGHVSSAESVTSSRASTGRRRPPIIRT